MAVTGGRTPYDPAGALTGPARVLYAPASVAVPVDMYDIIPGENVSGLYPPLTGWVDFGLAADAPQYSHSKEVQGLSYQQPSQDLFEQISKVERKFTAQVAQITETNIAILENSQVAGTTIAATLSGGEAQQKKQTFGLYDDFDTYRIAMVSYRPSGATLVTESDGTTRPTAVVLVLPACRLSAADTSFTFERGTPVNAGIEFTVFPETTLPSGSEHGFWIFEQPATFT